MGRWEIGAGVLVGEKGVLWGDGVGWWGGDSLWRSVKSVKGDGGKALAKENPETIGYRLD